MDEDEEEEPNADDSRQKAPTKAAQQAAIVETGTVREGEEEGVEATSSLHQNSRQSKGEG